MFKFTRYTLPLFLIAFSAHAQYLKNHKATLSVGGTGQFTTILNDDAEDVPAAAPLPVAGTYAVTVSNQKQYTTDSAGFLTSLQLQPAAWAGVEFNYGFTHYQERYTFNYINTATPTAQQQVRVPTDQHEATAAYLFHPKHIPFQPFLGIGGGAIDFAPTFGPNQWRETGLVEVGFDMPVHWSHIGFRVEGRSLIYRSPNFRQPAIATHSWRATTQPALSAFYRF